MPLQIIRQDIFKLFDEVDNKILDPINKWRKNCE